MINLHHKKPGWFINQSINKWCSGGLPLGCPVGKLGSVVRINGFFQLLLVGVYWGYNPLILTFDPNFPGGHPTAEVPSRLIRTTGRRKRRCRPRDEFVKKWTAALKRRGFNCWGQWERSIVATLVGGIDWKQIEMFEAPKISWNLWIFVDTFDIGFVNREFGGEYVSTKTTRNKGQNCWLIFFFILLYPYHPW